MAGAVRTARVTPKARSLAPLLSIMMSPTGVKCQVAGRPCCTGWT